jgi:hypothetical protein
LDDPRDLLLRVREKVLDSLQRLPRYLCTETVDRARYEPQIPELVTTAKGHASSCDDAIAAANQPSWKRRLTSSDRLRLDVAVSHGTPGVEDEMYSWVGEGRFTDRGLFDLVRNGAVSIGSFSSMLAAIFGGEASRFSYLGDNVVNSRTLSEFEFHVPAERSKYSYVYGEGHRQQVAVAYSGKVMIDPESAALVRLVVRTEALPAETGACEVTHVLDYAATPPGNGIDLLLPSAARVSVIHSDATEAENHIHFSACREFRGQSALRFGVSSEPGRVSAVKEQWSGIPSGLPFSVTFTDPIDTAGAAAGDSIRGRLKTGIRDRSSKAVVPDGAAVTGRIVGIRRYYPPPHQSGHSATASQGSPSLEIQIRLETVEIDGTSQPLHAAFDSGARRFSKSAGPIPVRIDIGSLDAARDAAAGVFVFWGTGADYVVKSGLESKWVTTSAGVAEGGKP